MAVTVNADIRLEALANPALPRGVQRWRAYGNVTGDVSGGTATVVFRTNPGAQGNYQPFISLYRVVFVGVTADPTDGYILRVATDFEEAAQDGTALRFGQLVTTALNSVWLAEWPGVGDGPWYFGRVTRGTVGAFRVEFPNVNTAEYHAWAFGLQSDRQTVADARIRV